MGFERCDDERDDRRMPLKIRRKARKFLRDLSEGDRGRVEDALRELVRGVEQGVIPLHLDVRKLRGRFEGYLRLRVGPYRIIFSVDLERGEVRVHRIARRKRAYR